MSKEFSQKISHDELESESIYLITHIDNKNVAFCQQIELMSYGNSAVISFGYELTPEKLRQLANELENKLLKDDDIVSQNSD